MKTFRDKNGFQVEPGEDWNDKKSDETIKYMTKPRNIPAVEPRRLANGGSSDTEVIVNNGKIQTKNEFIKSLPLEEQPGMISAELRHVRYGQRSCEYLTEK